LLVVLGCLCLGNSVTELHDELEAAELGEISRQRGESSADQYATARKVSESLKQQCLDAAEAVEYRKEDVKLMEAATSIVEEKACTCSVEKARIEELKKEMADAEDDESDPEACKDSPEYSTPYEKREYSSEMKVTNHTSRCAYEAQKTPCDDSQMKQGCAKTCGVGITDRNNYRGEPYVRYDKIKNLSTPQLSMCAAGKKRGACKQKYFQAGCNKTCGGGGNEDRNTQMDRNHFYRNPWAYEKKIYSSFCQFHKASGQCEQNAGQDLHSVGLPGKRGPGQRSYRGPPPCRKTCTGKGKDRREPKEYFGFKFKVSKYKNNCEYRAKSTANPCKADPSRNYRAANVQRMCAKTCTGKGEDNKMWSRWFIEREPVVNKTHPYKSKCEYVKEAGYCNSLRYGLTHCRKTCGLCGKTVQWTEPEAEQVTAKAPGTVNKEDEAKTEEEEVEKEKKEVEKEKEEVKTGTQGGGANQR
jgi:hypothetical protein